MQQQRREEVAKFIQTSIFSINEIASMCGVTLKTAYNVKQRILAGESIEHKGGAGPKKRLNKGDRISLFLAMKNNPPTSLPLCKTVSRLHEELMFHIRQWGDVWKGCRIPRKPPSKEQILENPSYLGHWNKYFLLHLARLEREARGPSSETFPQDPYLGWDINPWGNSSSRFKENFNSIAYCSVISECKTADLSRWLETSQFDWRNAPSNALIGICSPLWRAILKKRVKDSRRTKKLCEDWVGNLWSWFYYESVTTLWLLLTAKD